MAAQLKKDDRDLRITLSEVLARRATFISHSIIISSTATGIRRYSVAVGNRLLQSICCQNVQKLWTITDISKFQTIPNPQTASKLMDSPGRRVLETHKGPGDNTSRSWACGWVWPTVLQKSHLKGQFRQGKKDNEGNGTISLNYFFFFTFLFFGERAIAKG